VSGFSRTEEGCAMNYGRLVAAAVAATIIDAIYGFLVYGTLLTSEFAKHPGVYRPTDVQGGYMPLMFAGIFVAMLAATAIYSKGYAGGAGAAEGLRFGLRIGVFVIGYVSVVNYAITNIGRRLAGEMALAALVEWMVAGIVIGMTYRSAVRGASRPAHV
jgi:hypothetical protein